MDPVLEEDEVCECRGCSACEGSCFKSDREYTVPDPVITGEQLGVCRDCFAAWETHRRNRESE